MSSEDRKVENIFDYFLVSGLSTRHPPNWIDDGNGKHASDVRTPSVETISLKPCLLSRFPTNVVDNSWNTAVQGTLLQLCHPNGISITTENFATQPLFHSFPSTRDDGFRTYGHVLTYFEILTSNTTVNGIREQAAKTGISLPPEKIYAQKSICLISRHAYINTAESILRSLFKLFMSDKKELKGSNLSIDSYIYNLLYEMPIPAVGNSLALKWDSTKPVIVQNPSSNELPLLDTHLSTLFSLLGNASNVLRLMTSAFLEHQILLVSKDSQNLTLVAEAITSLMFPFQWFHLYAPVLPFHLARNFLDAPVPYIMGIPLGSSEEKLTRITSEFDQCFVDLDKALVDCPEDQPSFPNHIKLREGLNANYKKFKRNIEKVARSGHIVEESDLILIEEEVEPSPPLHRRNAQKRLSTIHKENETKISAEDKDDETESGSQSKSKANVMDAAEELKNLHAVSTFPSSNQTPSSPLLSELKSMKVDEVEIQQQLFNVQVRETIFGTLIALLSQYDKFVILPDIDDSDIDKRWFLTRESQQNFDKSSFLSDQPERHLKFLSAFLETQAFASLVDNCILSQIDSTFRDQGWSLFDDRIKQAKSMPRLEKPFREASVKLNPAIDMLSRSGTIISAGESVKNSIDKWTKSSENAVKRRCKNISGRYPRLRSFQSEETDSSEVIEPSKECHFPNILFPSLLQERMRDSEPKIYNASVVDLEPSWHDTQRAKSKLSRQASISEFSAETIAQTNWKFLEKLLKDVKAKTNKLVVRKMGQEAIALGHTESSIMGLEENTLIGSLCDLLERIWCHGLHSNQKKGKSALWSHLLRYEEDSVRIMRTPHNMVITDKGSHLAVSRGHTQSMSSLGITNPSDTSLDPTRRSDLSKSERRYSQPSVIDGQYIMPVPTDIISNIKRIRQLQEVKTNVGKCRAWIRLSLEQKQLQVHLKKLLLNRPLLQVMYKRYSLLRCDEEREQFLYHLLSLNAVDFTCFTNSFTKTAIQYRVWIFPKKQLSGASQTSANVYVMISGELACTDRIAIPKNCTDFSFQHQNLGVLTTAILGHDNTGLLPKWLVDFMLVRNEVTGQAYYLPCKRWLGRNIDDGSTQRLLLAHTVPHGRDLNAFIHDYTSGKISIDSPLLKVSTVNDLRDSAGQAVNAIVKHFHTPNQYLCTGALTPLFCKPTGLIPVLSRIFQHGLKTSGMFRKQLFAWDVVCASCDCLSGKSSMLKQNQTLYESTLSSLGDFIRNTSPQRSLAIKSPSASLSGRSSPQPSGRDEDGSIPQVQSFSSEVVLKRLFHYYNTIREEQDKGLGKDDMFQLLVCFGVKEHLLSDWIKCMSSVLIQGTMYNKNAFLCDRQAVLSLTSLLDNLSDYSITYESILLRGIENL